jgi:hypothetical protein
MERVASLRDSLDLRTGTPDLRPGLMNAALSGWNPIGSFHLLAQSQAHTKVHFLGLSPRG